MRDTVVAARLDKGLATDGARTRTQKQYQPTRRLINLVRKECTT